MNKTMRSPSHLVTLSRDVKSGKVQQLIDNEGYTISDLMLTYDVSRNVIRNYSSNGDLVFPKHTGTKRRVFSDTKSVMTDAKRLALGSWKLSGDIGTSTIDISSDDEEDKAMEQSTFDFDTETYLAFGTKIKPTDKPQTCPCCDQMVKLYKRRINKSMATDLIRLHQYGKGGYMHVEDFVAPRSTREVSKLKLWDLVETMPNDNPDKKSTGMYRITKKGEDFVEGKVMVRTYVQMYNNKFYGFDGGMVTISDALKEKFSYSELMAR